MLSLVEITAFRLESKLPPIRAIEFIRDHVTFKLPYDFNYHMKTPLLILSSRPESLWFCSHLLCSVQCILVIAICVSKWKDHGISFTVWQFSSIVYKKFKPKNWIKHFFFLFVLWVISTCFLCYFWNSYLPFLTLYASGILVLIFRISQCSSSYLIIYDAGVIKAN